MLVLIVSSYFNETALTKQLTTARPIMQLMHTMQKQPFEEINKHTKTQREVSSATCPCRAASMTVSCCQHLGSAFSAINGNEHTGEAQLPDQDSKADKPIKNYHNHAQKAGYYQACQGYLRIACRVVIDLQHGSGHAYRNVTSMEADKPWKKPAKC